MIVAALAAASAFAASAATLSESNGTTFTGLTAGDSFAAGSAAAESSKYYWYSEDSASGTVTNNNTYSSKRAEDWSDTTALSLEAANPLFRSAEGSATAYESADFTAVDLGDGIYIDTLVKLGVCDAAPEGGKVELARLRAAKAAHRARRMRRIRRRSQTRRPQGPRQEACASNEDC